MLAFLREDEDDASTLEVVGLSYGTKDVRDPAVRAAYAARVREMVEILALPDEVARRARTRAWLVRCAAHPATRWEGAYELQEPARRLDRSRGGPPEPDFAAGLEADEKAALARVLIESPTLEGAGTICLISLAPALDDPQRLVPRLRAELERVEAEGPTWWIGHAGDLMGAIGRMLRWEYGEALAAEFGRTESSVAGRELIRRFIDEMPAPR